MVSLGFPPFLCPTLSLAHLISLRSPVRPFSASALRHSSPCVPPVSTLPVAAPTTCSDGDFGARKGKWGLDKQAVNKQTANDQAAWSSATNGKPRGGRGF